MIFTKMTFAVILSLIFEISLIIIYFSKQRVDNIENRIYRGLIASNAIGLVLHLLCDYVSYNYDVLPHLFSIIILKALLIYYFSFGILLLLYLVTISFENRKRIETIINIISLICIVIICILPNSIVINKEQMIFYTNGPDTKFVFLISGIAIVTMFIIMALRFKTIAKTKMLPIYIFIVLATLSTVIQKSYPDIVLTDCMETLIVLLMYFTIENPDVKMMKELELAREQADKANRAKTDFLSSMSHEIRTPLNAINGFSNMIEESKTLEEAKANAKDIISASDTLLEIVNGILDISKIESGKLEIIESPYNAKETFEDLAKLITPRMNEKGLDFSYYIAPDLPDTLYGDHGNIKKIVTNFLSNACKYTEKGFVRYEVNCINAQNKCKLVISVEDSGRGIKKDKIDKLFTRFDRLDVERNTTVEGTGLGLAITKQLVELMGGKIIVHTIYGEGSKFTVMLDQKVEKTKVVEKKEKHNDVDLTSTKILLVDDNNLNLKVATKMLEKYGAKDITPASSGFECLDLVKENTYDIILLDDMMPKMSGTETLAELRKDPSFKTPVVALTANAISGMREKYLEQGFDEYLAKPIEQNEFTKVLEKLLNDDDDEEVNMVVDSSTEEEPKEEKEEMEEEVEEKANEEEQKK